MLKLPEICNTKINIRKKLICFFGRQQGRLKSGKFKGKDDFQIPNDRM